MPTPAVARPSATVVLVRPYASGWEAYLLRRSARSPVLANLWVFPGGTLRADDRAPEAHALASDMTADDAHAALARPPSYPPDEPTESMAYFVAAARELFEEAGVLLADRPLVTAERERAAARETVERGRALADLIRAAEARLTLAPLIYYAHWITPTAVPQRFDTRFFVAVLPEGQEASPSPHEMVEGRWISAADALEQSRAGELPLHFATVNHLRRLAAYPALDDLLRFAATKPVHPVMPNTRERDGTVMPHLPPELEGVW